MLPHLCATAGHCSVVSVRVEVSSTIHWLDYYSVPAALDMRKHLPLFELIGRACVTLWHPWIGQPQKVLSGPLWSLQVVLAHTSQKHKLCALCLCFWEVLDLPPEPNVDSQLLTWDISLHSVIISAFIFISAVWPSTASTQMTMGSSVTSWAPAKCVFGCLRAAEEVSCTPRQWVLPCLLVWLQARTWQRWQLSASVGLVRLRYS